MYIYSENTFMYIKQIQAICLLQTKIKINVIFMPASLTQKLIISCGL